MTSKKEICIGFVTLLLILPSLCVFAANKPQSATDVRATTKNRKAATTVAPPPVVPPPPDYRIASVTVQRSEGKIWGSAVLENLGPGSIAGTTVCLDGRGFKNLRGHKCGASGELVRIMPDGYPDLKVTVYGSVHVPSGQSESNPGNNSLKVELFPGQQQITHTR